MKNVMKLLAVYYYTILIVMATVMLTNCATQKDCCEKTAQAVYEYEGLTME